MSRSQQANSSYGILIVEDDDDTRANIRDILELDGYDVHEADSFSELFQRDDWDNITVILLDRILKDGDANEMLPRLREVAPLVPIVVTTGLPDLEGAIEALREGAYDYLFKPIDPDALRASLRRIVLLHETKTSLKHETGARQHAETKHRLLAEAISHLGEGVLITDAYLNGHLPRIVFVNDAIGQITGYSAGELLGNTPAILHGEETRPELLEQLYRAIRDEKAFRGELVYYRKDGTPFDVEIMVTPMFDAQGKCTNYVSVHRDITEKNRSARNLSDQEARLRAILETATDAIITIDRKGIINGINPAVTRIFGYHEQEIIGKNVKLLMPEPFQSEHDGYLTRYMATGEARIIGTGREVVAQRKDGSTFPVHLAVSRIDEPPLFTGIIRDISALKELQKQVLEIAAEEDRRIGHELHDNVQQQLTGLGLLSQSVAEMLSNAEKGDSKNQPTLAKVSRLAERIARGISEAGRDVHNLSRGLVPVEIDAEGLRSALVELAQRVHEQYGIQCRYHLNGDIGLANNFVATHLYRIVQEAVTNAIKHADARQIDIRLLGTDRSITMEVMDDGNGIGHRPDSTVGGGLKIMQYRSGLIGGVVRILPRPDGGTLVSCTVSRDGSFEVGK